MCQLPPSSYSPRPGRSAPKEMFESLFSGGSCTLDNHRQARGDRLPVSNVSKFCAELELRVKHDVTQSVGLRVRQLQQLGHHCLLLFRR